MREGLLSTGMVTHQGVSFFSVDCLVLRCSKHATCLEGAAENALAVYGIYIMVYSIKSFNSIFKNDSGGVFFLRAPTVSTNSGPTCETSVSGVRVKRIEAH